jgi:hypothetical protein
MIQFRCWYCNRRYLKSEEQTGQCFPCSCKHPLRVPKHNDGNCRVKNGTDRLVEAVVYGGGGGLLGFGLGVVILSQARGVMQYPLGWFVVTGLTLFGFLGGLLGGEAGVNWVGQMIREREKR